MDRAHKDALAERCGDLARAGAAVMVATHDTEFAATFADRVVLLGQGVPIADASPLEVLGGGWHFSTDVARITDGGALTPDDGRGAPARPAGGGARVSWALSSFAAARGGRGGRPGLVRARAPALARPGAGGRAGGACGGGPAGLRGDPEREAHHGHRALRRLRAGRGAGLRGGGDRGAGVERLPLPGPVDGVADGGMGDGGRGLGAAAGAHAAGREPSRLLLAAVCGAAGLAFGAWMDVYQWTLAARQDLDSYLAIAATSLPYNLAHAIGNVGFSLLIGPAFVRALRALPPPLRGALAGAGRRGGRRLCWPWWPCWPCPPRPWPRRPPARPSATC